MKYLKKFENLEKGKFWITPKTDVKFILKRLDVPLKYQQKILLEIKMSQSKYWITNYKNIIIINDIEHHLSAAPGLDWIWLYSYKHQKLELEEGYNMKYMGIIRAKKLEKDVEKYNL